MKNIKRTEISRSDFATGAREVILKHLKTRFLEESSLTIDDIKIVWVIKYGTVAERDWKGMFDTTLPDGRVYEVGYSARTVTYYVYVYAKLEAFQEKV